MIRRFKKYSLQKENRERLKIKLSNCKVLRFIGSNNSGSSEHVVYPVVTSSDTRCVAHARSTSASVDETCAMEDSHGRMQRCSIIAD